MGLVWECSIPARPAPFNFLNGTGMGIGLNKRGGVGRGAPRPEPAPLPSLNWYSLSPSYSNVKINFKKVKIDSGINQISLISRISIYCKYVVF